MTTQTMATQATQAKKIEEYAHYINGKVYSGKSHRYQDVYNPALGTVLGKAPLAAAAEVNEAVAAAQAAFTTWRHVPPAKRATIMFNFRNLILEHQATIAEIISREHGKTLVDAKGSLMRGLEVVEYCTGIASHLKSDFTSDVASNIDTYNIRQPLGVCAGITPFNFPAMVPMWMFPLAIACGNTFVLKPSERDPGTALYLAKLFQQAGLPAGVFNVVIGDKEAVDVLLMHQDIKAISFVGSTAVGEQIYQRGCAAGKRVQALCGAKNHLVVMPDADIDKTVDALMGSAYGSAGERCMAISVAVAVGDSVADAVRTGLQKRIQALKIGPYTHPQTEMGPIISKESLARIEKYIADGAAAGAEIVEDGRKLTKTPAMATGYYTGATLIDRVQPQMNVYTDEIFGPVLSLVRVKTYAEALELVNEHEYGNGVAIFTRDGDTARHFAQHCEIGMVGVNIPIPVPVAYHSFGGWKRSIFGGFAIHGMEGLRFYTRLKTITTRWFSGMRAGAAFHFTGGKDAS